MEEERPGEERGERGWPWPDTGSLRYSKVSTAPCSPVKPQIFCWCEVRPDGFTSQLQHQTPPLLVKYLLRLGDSVAVWQVQILREHYMGGEVCGASLYSRQALNSSIALLYRKHPSLPHCRPSSTLQLQMLRLRGGNSPDTARTDHRCLIARYIIEAKHVIILHINSIVNIYSDLVVVVDFHTLSQHYELPVVIAV